MGIKIQINSLDALERLIGGDTELEIELRRAVAVELGKRHLKDAITKDFDKEVIQSTKKEIIFEINKTIEKTLGSSMYWTSNEEKRIPEKKMEQIKQSVDEFIDKKMNTLIQDKLNDLFKDNLLLSRIHLDIEKCIMGIVRYEFYDMIKNTINNKLKKETKFVDYIFSKIKKSIDKII